MHEQQQIDLLRFLAKLAGVIHAVAQQEADNLRAVQSPHATVAQELADGIADTVQDCEIQHVIDAYDREQQERADAYDRGYPARCRMIERMGL